MPLMKLEMGDDDELLFELELDTTEYVGQLNFSKFRNILASMLVNVHHRLEAQESANPMRSDNGELMFNIPGVFNSEGTINIMVCSFRQLAPGLSLVRLMYLNPEAYAEAAGIDLNSIQQSDQPLEFDTRA